MKLKQAILAGIATGALMLSGCGISQSAVPAVATTATAATTATTTANTTVATTTTTTTPPTQVPTTAAHHATSAQDMLDNMTLEQKIGQLFIIRPESLCTNLTSDQINNASDYGVTELTKAMKTQLAKYPVGGVALFGKNISSASQLPTFIADMQTASRIPLFVSVDEEGGLVSRVANSGYFDVPTYDSMGAIGDTGDTANAKAVGKTIGGYLRPLGFNLDFAPDADTNTNPNNVIIGTRSFGDDPTLVGKMVCAQLDGMHESGVMGCIKHFPGHGDTTADTHSGYVKVEKTWSQLKSCDLVPFIAALNKTDMVMAAHITAVNVTSDGLPSSLSREMITDKLRGELGYDGVVITDSMSMGAIVQDYSPAEAAVKAINAGVDIILMPQDLAKAYNGILNAVNNGNISTDRIDQSVLRILQLKIKYGVVDPEQF